MNCTWSNCWLHHNAKIIVAYRTLNHRLVIETWQWMSIPICRDTRLCHFCSYGEIKNKAHFMLECPIYIPITHKFPSLSENAVLGSLKSFFQSDQQVNISLYLKEASTLRHSKKLNDLKSSWCAFNPISLFGFPDFKINLISLEKKHVVAVCTLCNKHWLRAVRT